MLRFGAFNYELYFLGGGRKLLSATEPTRLIFGEL